MIIYEIEKGREITEDFQDWLYRATIDGIESVSTDFLPMGELAKELARTYYQAFAQYTFISRKVSRGCFRVSQRNDYIQLSGVTDTELDTLRRFFIQKAQEYKSQQNNSQPLEARMQ